jgi:hypothetical protein
MRQRPPRSPPRQIRNGGRHRRRLQSRPSPPGLPSSLPCHCPRHLRSRHRRPRQRCRRFRRCRPRRTLHRHDLRCQRLLQPPIRRSRRRYLRCRRRRRTVHRRGLHFQRRRYLPNRDLSSSCPSIRSRRGSRADARTPQWNLDDRSGTSCLSSAHTCPRMQVSSHLVGISRAEAGIQRGAKRPFISSLRPVPKKSRGAQSNACWKAR